MLMAYIWVGMLAVSVLYGSFAGNMQSVSTAVMDGAAAAVELCISIGGALCLWTGFMELLRRCDLAQRLAKLLSPILRRVFPIS